MITMALPAANLQTAGKKKPTVNAAATARVGYSKESEAIMTESNARINGLDITVAAAPTKGGQQ